MSEESTKPYLYFERIMNGIVSIPASVEAKLSNVMLVRRQELNKRSSSDSDSGSEESESSSEESRTPFSVVKSWFSKRTEFPSNSSNSVQEQSSEEQSSEEQSEEPLVQKPEHLFEMKCNIRGW